MADNNAILQLDGLSTVKPRPGTCGIQLGIDMRVLLQDLALVVLLELGELGTRCLHHALGGDGSVAPEHFDGASLAVSGHFGIGVGASLVVGELDLHRIGVVVRRRRGRGRVALPVVAGQHSRGKESSSCEESELHSEWIRLGLEGG